MEPRSTLRRLASALHRRYTVRTEPRGGEAVAPGPAAGPPAPEDPVAAEIAASLGARIEAKWSRPHEWTDRDNNLNHIRRYITSLRWLPPGGRLLDPAGGGGLFVDLVREELDC